MAALFMVFLLLSFLVADILYRKFQTAKQGAISSVGITNEMKLPIEINADNIPILDGLFFHRGHTWVKIDDSGKVYVGIDDFLRKFIGKIDNLKAPEIGEIVAQDEKAFLIQQGDRKASLLSPVDGIVQEVNKDAINALKDAKNAADGKNWLIAIKPTNLMENIKNLLIADGARIWLKTEVARFKEFLAEQFAYDKNLGKVMADGGAPVEGIMEQMDDFSWTKFEEEFLHE